MSSKRFGERLTRLKSMSHVELRERGLQELFKRVDVLRFHLNGKRALKISLPPATTAGSFFFYPHQVPEIISLLRELLPDQAKDIVARAEKICTHRFDLLGYEDLDYGVKIDWHLDRVHGKRAPRKPWHQIHYLDFNEVGDTKITWELNRHQHLVTLAKAYLLSRDERFAREIFAQWYDWIENNPHPIGINWASSLEVAFRCISWLWVGYLLAGTPAIPQKFEADLRKALAISGRHIERYLSTFFSPNTHLLGEGVALFFIGTLVPELPRSEKWKQLGWRIVLEEARRQVRPDGLHFEQSSYYHVYALDFFLHAILLAARNNIEIPEPLEQKVEQMLEILWTLSRAGITHPFGDDDGGRLFDSRRNRAEHLADPLCTGAVLFGRSDFKAVAGSLREETLWLVGAEGAARFAHIAAAQVKPRSVAFEDSGLYVMSDANAQVLIDAGPHGAHTAGHGHADALSVQLVQSGKLLLIDPGTYEYVGDDSARSRFRGTAAHNTVQVDRLDQSRPKGPFSWTSFAETTVHNWVTGESFDLFVGSHDGYSSLQCPVIHRRWVFHRNADFWLIRDVAEGSGRHHLAAHWHLAPGMVQHRPGVPLFLLPGADTGIALITAADMKWTLQLAGGESSPCYGQRKTAPVIRFESETSLPAELATIVLPGTSGAELGTLVQLQKTEQSGPTAGYSYSKGEEKHLFFFSSSGQVWTFEDWSSDADFVYCHECRGRVEAIIFCNGTYVSFKGNRIASARLRINRCELTESGARKVISPANEVLVFHHWPQITGQDKGARLEPAPAGIGG